MFTGDLLFIGSTPIMWARPAASWIDELDRMLALDADTFVPVHGPVTDACGPSATTSSSLPSRTCPTESIA